jgi:hypothetical protein
MMDKAKSLRVEPKPDLHPKGELKSISLINITHPSLEEVLCNTPGVCHSLSSGFELKHDRLSGDDDVKANLWR